MESGKFSACLRPSRWLLFAALLSLVAALLGKPAATATIGAHSKLERLVSKSHKVASNLRGKIPVVISKLSPHEPVSQKLTPVDYIVDPHGPIIDQLDILTRVKDEQQLEVVLTPEEELAIAKNTIEGDQPLFLNLGGDVVASRVGLPKKYVEPHQMSPKPGQICFQHLGCIDELPTVPSILKRLDFNSVFTIYTPDGPPAGHKIDFEPTIHYELIDKSKPNSEDQARHPTLRFTAPSWQSEDAVLSPPVLYPFDLSAVALSKFDSSLNTRVIIGGYFSKEKSRWIEGVIESWRALEPNSNIIKVSWNNANRGIYQSAAYNTRIIARQLVAFLYYLDQYFGLDLDKFHIVGHSLGAHIAGAVGGELGGKVARITGLDPAGPIFVNLNKKLRLDPSDAQFVDVIHTNGGSILSGALGMSQPLGHVDYYPNGGSNQLGCGFMQLKSSNPLARFACAHRRSHDYFIELIQMAVANEGDLEKMPRAYLFDAAIESQPADLVNQEILSPSSRTSVESPWMRPVEFHLLHPVNRERGKYMFATLPEAPFLQAKQSILSIDFGLKSSVKARVNLLLKVGGLIVADVNLDEIPAQKLAILFAMPLTNSQQSAHVRFMWRYRLADAIFRRKQPEEMHFKRIEIKSLDGASDWEGNLMMKASPVNLVHRVWYSFIARDQSVEGSEALVAEGVASDQELAAIDAQPADAR